MSRSPVLTFTQKGIYCPDGDFFIDPHRPVDRAVVTHGHSDHARPGHRHYLATHAALPVIRQRLGKITAEGLNWGEARRIGGVTVSLHPAGHVPGSAQVRVERDGERARIIVADQGEGLDEDQQARVFTKFERLGRQGDGGSGLGLYISRRLAEAMGGSLTVESAKGQGARFTLELPADLSA